MSVVEVTDDFDSQKMMDEVLDIIKGLTNDDGDITRKIVNPFQKIDSKFVNSKGFYEFLASTATNLKDRPDDKFVIIYGLIDELKAYIGQKKRKSETNLAPDQKKAKYNENISEEIRAKRLRKLEKLLQSLHRRIKEEEEKDLSLDDLDNENSHTYVHRLKRKLVAVYSKICELEERELNLGRKIERKINFNATCYSELNKKVSKLVNQGRHFPDFFDILTLVQRCNDKYHYNLSERRIDTLARDIFTQVGNALQRRRQDDDRQNFGCHLTDNSNLNDPAESNYELRKQLEENKKMHTRRIDDIMHKYTKLQEEGEDTDESSTEEDSGSESCEEETVLDVSQDLLEDFPTPTETSAPCLELSDESVDETEDEILISCLSNSPKDKNSQTNATVAIMKRSTARKSTAPRKSASAKRQSQSPKNNNGIGDDCNEKAVSDGKAEDDDDDICILDVKESDEVRNHQPNPFPKNYLPESKKEKQTNNNADKLLIVISDSD